jgi:hypothetical protein
MVRDFSNKLAMHDFDRGAFAPVVSFIEMVRYMSHKDPDELEKILVELRQKPSPPIGGWRDE